MKPFQQIFYMSAIVALGSNVVAAVPLDVTIAKQEGELVNGKPEDLQASKSAPIATAVNQTEKDKDLETANSNPEPAYVLPDQHASGSGSGHIDPTLYSGYLTPESFQQYLAQFAGAFGPYGYPGYGPAPVYPAPYAVQTGYEGLLAPAASISATGAISNTSGGVLNALANIVTALMESTIFRVIATVIGAIIMMIFGGAITRAFCNLTPFCDLLSFKNVEYLKSKDAGDVGRMLAEGITPERIKRTSEFVRNAIRKYTELQKILAEENDDDEE